MLQIISGFSKTAPISGSSRQEVLSAVFFPILKPGVKKEFLSVWENWFVTKDSILDEKTPGKMKSKFYLIKMILNTNLLLRFYSAEFETAKGTFVALGNKMYQGYAPETDVTKKSTKGVPSRNQFKMRLFQSVLLDEKTPRQKITINSLRLNKNKEISRMKMEKSSLSDIFVKMQVLADKITCAPLSKNGKYL